MIKILLLRMIPGLAKFSDLTLGRFSVMSCRHLGRRASTKLKAASRSDFRFDLMLPENGFQVLERTVKRMSSVHS